ncbi:expressed unknown protein [Seminavis robusta]|uniref:Uncharacterized protein n=1 Tax=Seminavis robusta TaxID=568900 RepID=A0A9N8DME9_9STRA|nr:expressed unknown protein [Seminavis robusta]|eukprot:Sro159_g071930.1 n/a (169) ;mRNA; r:81422-81928
MDRNWTTVLPRKSKKKGNKGNAAEGTGMVPLGQLSANTMSRADFPPLEAATTNHNHEVTATDNSNKASTSTPINKEDDTRSLRYSLFYSCVFNIAEEELEQDQEQGSVPRDDIGSFGVDEYESAGRSSASLVPPLMETCRQHTRKAKCQNFHTRSASHQLVAPHSPPL